MARHRPVRTAFRNHVHSRLRRQYYGPWSVEDFEAPQVGISGNAITYSCNEADPRDCLFSIKHKGRIFDILISPSSFERSHLDEERYDKFLQAKKVKEDLGKGRILPANAIWSHSLPSPGKFFVWLIDKCEPLFAEHRGHAIGVPPFVNMPALESALHFYETRGAKISLSDILYPPHFAYEFRSRRAKISFTPMEPMQHDLQGNWRVARFPISWSLRRELIDRNVPLIHPSAVKVKYQDPVFVWPKDRTPMVFSALDKSGQRKPCFFKKFLARDPLDPEEVLRYELNRIIFRGSRRKSWRTRFDMLAVVVADDGQVLGMLLSAYDSLAGSK